jgi:hypothetical protein
MQKGALKFYVFRGVVWTSILDSTLTTDFGIFVTNLEICLLGMVDPEEGGIKSSKTI